MQIVVEVARFVLLTTAVVCLALSMLYLTDAVRAMIAHTRLRAGDYDGAISIYRKLLNHAWQPYTKRRAIAYNAAVCLHRSGDLEGSRQLLERLITDDLDPTLDSLAHALLAQTLVLLGRDFDRAEAALAKAGATLAFSHFGLTRAILNLLAGDRESARRDFEAFQAAGSPDAVVGLGTMALVERDFETTMRSYFLGLYYLLSGDRGAARSSLECAARAAVPSVYRESARTLLARA
jgi:tetratricopeptide (TPR) repeat protein